MNPRLAKLQPYPFQRWKEARAGVIPADKPAISWGIGEPKHAPPPRVIEALTRSMALLGRYPPTQGEPALRQAIADWLRRRFSIPEGWLDPERHVLPVNGTREALFCFVQAVHSGSPRALILCPNPCYQIYEGAAILAGAEPYFLPCLAENGYRPDFEAVPDAVWERCEVLFTCSPGNPTGAVLPLRTLSSLIEKADRFDFLIASDECYSELFFDEAAPPVGLLEACAALGRDDFRRCVVFHSLSKRSNLPGLRSGFMAGDAAVMADLLEYRKYHGSAMPLQVSAASIAAWSDEDHVIANRALYADKFRRVLEILGPALGLDFPEGAFYLWAPTPPGEDDEAFALRLLREQNLTVLPGRYLSRERDGVDPGAGHVRIALVAEASECVEGARRMAAALGGAEAS